MRNARYHVYVITESVPKFRRTHEDVVQAALEGGADLIQFRDKTMGDSEFEAVARRLLTLCRAKGVPLIINDRVEIAVKIGADGAHVGHEDFVADSTHICQLRQMWDARIEEPIIGVSARNYEEAIALDDCGANYLGVGPVFATGSKSDASEPIGVTELYRICKAVRTPVVAIGGITYSNLPGIIECGAAGAAVISAVTHAADMKLATELLQDSWKRYHASLPNT